MKKIILFSVMLTISSSAYAKEMHYFGGQKEYLQQCRVCHGGSSVFVVNYTMKQWEDFMVNDGKDIGLRHINSNQYKSIQAEKKLKPYFETERYQKRLPYMNVFLKRFAKDSTNSPLKK
ncbi:hypothetical protein [Candidatus Sulfurimonas baltica]|uniref:Cytochrome c n=1 Tax=Candidatus Sulfurimonas baltica TaxID=2740404 RepID=A0A7S7RLF9_9BACT|nr:hypothetical protein [Candidatus Sulfurimonas baltica]QOY51102.1 hypothetical protein HUE88_08095 [Candidatus Sulfurimonas baltica]